MSATKNERSSSSLKCLSPIASVDPMVRALNTVMYGLVVHFGTWWLFGSNIFYNSSSNNACDTCPNSWYWLQSTLLLHEYWVYLQHTNVLANPYCQRLDRQYGIALLKSNQHWAIAGTLSVRHFKKTRATCVCLSFMPKPLTNMTSSKYHAPGLGLLVSRIHWHVCLFAISNR